MKPLLYRRRKKSQVWHDHPECQHWTVMGVNFIEKRTKPKSGERCNECMAKRRRDKLRASSVR